MKKDSVLQLLLFAYLSVAIFSEKQLKFVQVIWRHGDRAPIKLPYPKDHYKEEFWPRGFAQLTSLGMQQMYELGVFLRERYIDSGFLSREFNFTSMKIESSATDRALVSAQSLLYGMFPANGSLKWKTNNDWQPIPVKSTTPKQPDIICKATSIKCKKHKPKNMLKKYGKIYNEKYYRFFSEICPTLGFEKCSFEEIKGMYDIQRELIHNMTDKQPKWVFKSWPEYGNRSSMEIIEEMRTTKMVEQFESELAAKLRGGTLLHDFRKHAIKSTSNKLKVKIHMLSSHDGVLLAFLSVLKASNKLMAPYASAIIMEVYKEDNNHFVEFLYRNETNNPPYLMTLGRCPPPCTVKKFARVYKNLTIENYEEMMMLCGTPVRYSKAIDPDDDDSFSSSLFYIFNIFLPFILFGLSFF